MCGEQSTYESKKKQILSKQDKLAVEIERYNGIISGFPYMEFGITKGVVSDDIPVPEKGQDGSVNYRVGIKLPSELVTTYEKRLPFIPRMNGDAEVIVEDRRLIETILGPVKSIMKWDAELLKFIINDRDNQE